VAYLLRYQTGYLLCLSILGQRHQVFDPSPNKLDYSVVAIELEVVKQLCLVVAIDQVKLIHTCFWCPASTG
jgi:hypothetical protein